jgi:hypothetical protein
MKYITGVFLIVCHLQVCAQEDSTNRKTFTYLPLIHFSKAEIQRLPIISFPELINQMFSFSSFYLYQEDDYTYEVDGYITIHPNSINIGQIENITFYPGGTWRTRTNLTRKGTFVITTTKPDRKNALSVSANTGVELGNHKFPFASPPYKSESDPSFFTLDEVVYSSRFKNFFISSSFSFLRRGDPPTLAIAPTDTQYFDDVNKRYRFSNFLGYQFNERVSMNAGVFFTSQDNDNLGKQAFNYNPPAYVNESVGATRSNYFGAFVGLNTILMKKVYNDFRVEGNQLRGHGGSIGVFQTGNLYRKSDFSFNNRDEYYSFSNSTYGTYHISTMLNIQPSLFLRYKWNKHRSISGVTITDNNGFPVQASYSMSTINSKGFSASPEISFSVKDFLVIYGGGTFDNYRISIYSNDDSKLKFYPVGGFRFDAAPLIGKSKISELYISSDYNRYISTQEKMNVSFDPSVYTGSTAIIPFTGSPDNTATGWLSSIGTSLFNKRLGLKVNYINEDLQALFYVPITGSLYTYTFSPIERKGWGM